MTPIRYLLLADGPSDRCLLPVIDYALRSVPALAGRDLVSDFASTGDVGKASDGLEVRIGSALARRPCDLLFVHRDAESEPFDKRREEIASATRSDAPPVVPIVPVRMSEAWLLIDLAVIRRVADNPSGRVPLQLPPLKRLEDLPNPKQVLTDLLVAASEKSGRPLAKFKQKSEMSQRRTRVANLIGDFSPLNGLPAFRAFLVATSEAAGRLGT